MIEEIAVLGCDNRLDYPIVLRCSVERTAIDIARAERNARDLPGSVAQNDSAGIFPGAFVRPINREPRYGQRQS